MFKLKIIFQITLNVIDFIQHKRLYLQIIQVYGNDFFSNKLIDSKPLSVISKTGSVN